MSSSEFYGPLGSPGPKIRSVSGTPLICSSCGGEATEPVDLLRSFWQHCKSCREKAVKSFEAIKNSRRGK